MLIKPLHLFLLIIYLSIFSIQCSQAYRKYYVEDECMSPNRFQKVLFKLLSSGPDSAGELRPNRFGTYSRMGRQCLIKLVPPKGFAVTITVLKVDFRNHEGCKDYVKIYDDNDDGEKLCGRPEVGLKGKTYFSDGELKILYHTSEGGMGFSNGFRLIFTVTKLDEEPGACTDPDQFKCANSRCIWAGLTCDGVNNCGDGSDENSTDGPHCHDITPVAITAVVLGVTTFVAILVIMCLCCCRAQPEKTCKMPMIDDFPFRPNAGYRPLPGYTPLPGFTYGTSSAVSHPQPVHSTAVHASAPVDYYPSCPPNTGVPFVQQKVEFRYDRPPPYRA